MSEVAKAYGTQESSMKACLGEEIDPQLAKVLDAIGQAVAEIGQGMRDGALSGFGCGQAGTENSFGDNQLEVDLKTDEIVFRNLRESGACTFGSSEETVEEVSLGGDGYGVAFDPLDGSSIVDANFSVGSIFGVWPDPEKKGFLNRTGRDQTAACMAVFGPRITMAVAITTPSTKCIEVTYAAGKWHKTNDFTNTIAPEGKIFAPGNLRATNDSEEYRKLVVDHWIGGRYTLRYTGGMVPDVYHILIKKKGFFCNISSEKAKAKLRLLYEVAPIALIVEAAGGRSCDEKSQKSALDVVVDNLDKRMGVAYGSSGEMETFVKTMFAA